MSRSVRLQAWVPPASDAPTSKLPNRNLQEEVKDAYPAIPDIVATDDERCQPLPDWCLPEARDVQA
jgi:hypothetical protein